jgi:hypothetical protein
MYKDKEAQKEAMREANKRARGKRKGISPTAVDIPENDIPCDIPYVFSESGGKISIDKLIDYGPRGWRELINYLSTNLKPAYQEDLRIGVGGVTVSEARGLVECVG